MDTDRLAKKYGWDSGDVMVRLPTWEEKRRLLKDFRKRQRDTSRFAKAGSADDCGHNVSGSRQAGKFAPGNECAGGGGTPDYDLEDRVSALERKAQRQSDPKKRQQLLKAAADASKPTGKSSVREPVSHDPSRHIKSKPVYGNMAEARREGTGKEAKIVMADGSKPPTHVSPSMIPPAWTNVKVSTDPKAEVLVTGRDEKGHGHIVTTASYKARAAASKFSRVDEMLEKYDKIVSQIHKARTDPATKEVADVAWLMQVHGIRVGTGADTGAKHKAYGASTLQARHVVIPEGGKGVYLRFVGKKGVNQSHLIKNEELAKMLVDRKLSTKNPDDKIFNTDYKSVESFIANLDGGKFSAKDFRTAAASRLATLLVSQRKRPPKTKKDYKAFVKEVAVKVSSLLGNKPSEALKSYINPMVFADWNKNI